MVAECFGVQLVLTRFQPNGFFFQSTKSTQYCIENAISHIQSNPYEHFCCEQQRTAKTDETRLTLRRKCTTNGTEEDITIYTERVSICSTCSTCRVISVSKLHLHSPLGVLDIHESTEKSCCCCSVDIGHNSKM